MSLIINDLSEVTDSKLRAPEKYDMLRINDLRSLGQVMKGGYLSRRPPVEPLPTPGTPPPRSGQKKGFLAMGGWHQHTPRRRAAPEMARQGVLILTMGH